MFELKSIMDDIFNVILYQSFILRLQTNEILSEASCSYLKSWKQSSHHVIYEHCSAGTVRVIWIRIGTFNTEPA